MNEIFKNLGKKTCYQIAGGFFLLRAAYSLYTLLMRQAFLYAPLYITFINLCGILLGIVLGVTALRIKDRSMILNIIAGVYVVTIAASALSTMFTMGLKASSALVTAVISIAIVIVALMMSSSKSAFFNVKDTVSEAAKQQIQAEKQTTIYDEQLRDGIITQEEYDQIMGKK